MRRLGLPGFLIFAGCTVLVTQNHERGPSVDTQPYRDLVDLERALAIIEEIDTYGDRIPGTNAELASRVAEMFQSAGVEDVVLDDFPAPIFREGASELTILEPPDAAGEMPHLVNQFTGIGRVEGAEVYDYRNAREVEEEAAGKVVLIDALQTSSIRVQYDNAVESGAAAIIFNSNVDGGFLRQRHVWRFERKGALTGPLPAVSIGKEDALALRARLESGETIRVNLETNASVEQAVGHTVVARIPGTDHSEAIHINAHIDSWFGGIIDNVQAVAALLELARVFSEIPPAYDLELVAFDVEETGLLGSASYLRDRTPGARDRYAAAITLEMLAPTAPELTIACIDPLGRDAGEEIWEPILSESGLATTFSTVLSASDMMVAFNGEVPADQKNFWERGIPGFFLVTTYSPYHTELDATALQDEARLDEVLRQIVDAVARLQTIPPEVLNTPPASWIEIELADPLIPEAGEPLGGAIDLVLNRTGESLERAEVVVTLYDGEGARVLDEAAPTEVAPGRYSFEFERPLAPGTSYIVSTSAVGSLGSGRNWFRVVTPGSPAPDFPYTPTGFDPSTLPDGPSDLQLSCGGRQVLDTSEATVSVCGETLALEAHAQADGSTAALLVVNSLTLASGTDIELRGARPLVVAALGDVTIEGVIDGGGVGETSGAGGGHPTYCAGSNGSDGQGAGGGGAGGALPGGDGATPGGAATEDLDSLHGGCLGGPASNGGPGGAGGGLQISAGGRLIIDGNIEVSGGGGGPLAGGGSGGTIRLEASQLSITGVVRSLGGGGGSLSDSGADGRDGGDGARGNGNNPSGGDGGENPTAGTNGGAGGGSPGRIHLRGEESCVTASADIGPVPERTSACLE